MAVRRRAWTRADLIGVLHLPTPLLDRNQGGNRARFAA